MLTCECGFSANVNVGDRRTVVTTATQTLTITAQWECPECGQTNTFYIIGTYDAAVDTLANNHTGASAPHFWKEHHG